MSSRRNKGHGGKHRNLRRYSTVEVNIESLLLIENHCTGCAKGDPCCCSSYEVCVTEAEVKRIIRFLPEAAKLCPHLLSGEGYDNVFEEEEPGLFSIDTDGDGLCVFGYRVYGRTQCSLHTAAVALGVPVQEVKPKVCQLWPLHFSDGEEVLALISDFGRFKCNKRNRSGSRCLSPAFIETIERVYGEGCGAQVKTAAERGERRTLLIARR